MRVDTTDRTDGRRARSLLGVALMLAGTLLCGGASAAASADPVLMVISNQDFYYQEYGDTRQSLEAAGLEVVVAAATTEVARPHGPGGARVWPDLALADVKAEDYSAIVFVGGWGSSMYQYGFEGTYHNAAYRSDGRVVAAVNRLIGAMLAADRPVAAICHGVSVLAWARVDGVSPLAGRVVVGSSMLSPSFELGGIELSEIPARWHVQENGGRMLTSGSVGDPQTSADDVIVDGNIITGENLVAARHFGSVLAKAVSD